MKKATLILEDGSRYEGYAFGALRPSAGEVVFNTAMTGYPESLTDPSYKGQILVATYSAIGNYGVPGKEKEDSLERNFESDKLHLSGFIISDYSKEYSHYDAEMSLAEWMKRNGVPGIYGIDTRSLTRHIRNKGSMLGKIVTEELDTDFYDPAKENLVAQVSIKNKEIYGKGKYRILLIDCGLKNNIIRHLLARDTTVIRVPWDYDISREDYDGLFISNGPGDPKKCTVTIENLKKAYGRDEPMFGICLGSQLMALAAGANTYKMDYGHRGHNQPVLHLTDNQAYITSQNHGYAVEEDSLPPSWKTLFRNLNDATVEGVYHSKKPFFSTQFHPEASGGPTDTEFLFDVFIEKVKQHKTGK